MQTNSGMEKARQPSGLGNMGGMGTAISRNAQAAGHSSHGKGINDRHGGDNHGQPGSNINH